VNAGGAFSAVFFREKHPLAATMTSVSNETVMNLIRFALFTGGQTNESQRRCHWSFRSGDICDDAVNIFEKRAQAAD
jgi:hypothetical protein